MERVTDIVADQLGVDKEKITAETSFVNDLGADSLDTVELVMELEEEFDINIRRPGGSIHRSRHEQQGLIVRISTEQGARIRE